LRKRPAGEGAALPLTGDLPPLMRLRRAVVAAMPRAPQSQRLRPRAPGPIPPLVGSGVRGSESPTHLHRIRGVHTPGWAEAPVTYARARRLGAVAPSRWVGESHAPSSNQGVHTPGWAEAPVTYARARRLGAVAPSRRSRSPTVLPKIRGYPSQGCRRRISRPLTSLNGLLERDGSS